MGIRNIHFDGASQISMHLSRLCLNSPTKKKSQNFVLIYKCWCSFAISELFVTNLKAATGEKIIPDFQNASTVTGLNEPFSTYHQLQVFKYRSKHKILPHHITWLIHTYLLRKDHAANSKNKELETQNYIDIQGCMSMNWTSLQQLDSFVQQINRPISMIDCGHKI